MKYRLITSHSEPVSDETLEIMVALMAESYPTFIKERFLKERRFRAMTANGVVNISLLEDVNG